MSDFAAWLREQLQSMEVDAEVYGGYVEGIMADDSGFEERLQSVIELLRAATEADLLTFYQDLRSAWEKHKSGQRAVDHKAVLAEHMNSLNNDKRLAQEEQQRHAWKQVSRHSNPDETLDRDALLKRYAFGADAVDEEGNLIEAASKVSDADLCLHAALGGPNTNKSQVADCERDRREKAKRDHENKVLRERELLAQDKMRKEQEKRRTMKKEKQRGRG